MTKKRFGGLAAALLLLAVVVWWFGWRDRASSSDPRNMPAPEFVASTQNAPGGALETLAPQAPPEQRLTAFARGFNHGYLLMVRRLEEDYDKLMALSPAERIKELDRRINEMSKAHTAPAMLGLDMTPQQFDSFRKKMLALSTPEQRSKISNGMLLLQERMKQRGIAPPPLPGFN